MKNTSVTPKSSFPPLLSLTYVLQQSSDEVLTKEAGVSLSQARIMSALGSMPVSQRAVAVSLHQTEANVSRQLHVMKKHGLVSVLKNRQDGRQRDVSLTRKGAARYQKARKILIAQQRNFLKTMSTGEADILEFAVQKLSTKL